MQVCASTLNGGYINATEHEQNHPIDTPTAPSFDALVEHIGAQQRFIKMLPHLHDEGSGVGAAFLHGGCDHFLRKVCRRTHIHAIGALGGDAR